MAILRLLIFDKGSWYAKKSLYTLFQAWVTKVQCCLLQKCKCRLRSADSAAGPNEMSTLGCALHCPYTLPASVLTVTVTKCLTAEITITMLLWNWSSTLSIFLSLFFFCLLWQKWSPLPHEYPAPCSSVAPLSSPSPLCLSEHHHPSVGRAVLVLHPRCLPSLPFTRGNGPFLLLSFQCLPNTSTAHKPLKQRLCSTACL